MSPLDSIRYHKSFLRTAFMSMDPRTGQVKAYVGGIDYNDFQYDMVNGGRRQIGSTMKPFLYSLAMIEGISPLRPDATCAAAVDGRERSFVGSP